MSSLRSIKLRLIDEVFRGDAGKGWILDFSNRTFSDFVARELDIDIEEPRYAADGDSKAKGPDASWVKLVMTPQRFGNSAKRCEGALQPDPTPRAVGQIATLIAKLEEGGTSTPQNAVAAPILDAIDFLKLRDIDQGGIGN